MIVLVTGVAGFIGHHVAQALLDRGERVVGIDNLNDYYDVRLKQARLKRLEGRNGFAFQKINIADFRLVMALKDQFPDIDRIVHLAAQAGVRYSLVNPFAYMDSNGTGHLAMLEFARALPVCRSMVYASSSSVYGANTKLPFSVEDRTDTPVSLYGATKKACELMSQSYAHLFRIPLIGLRFFTVYGPWGRPDMALFKFTKAILDGQPIDVYNHGDMWRDFTYVEDLVRAIALLIDAVPPAAAGRNPAQAIEGDSLSPVAPWRVVNIGNSDKVRLLDFIDAIEQCLGQKAIRNHLPIQPGDVPASWADTQLLQRLTGYKPATGFQQGVQAFVRWYCEHHRP